MDFRQLQYVMAVADCRSITKAAERLYMSQPALSHYIQKTEKELGVSLFDRTTSPIGLTYAGELYINTAQEILMLNNNLQRQFQDISDNQIGRLRLGIPRDRASYMLPALLPRFAQRYPDIRVKTHTGGTDTLEELLVKGRIDFMIAPYFTPKAGLECQLIHEEPLMLVARKGIIKQEHLHQGLTDTVDLQKLSDLPFLALPTGRASRNAIDVLFRSYQVKPKSIEEYDSNITIAGLAAAGVGVAIIPNMIIRTIMLNEETQLFKVGTPPLKWEVQAVYRKDTYISQPEQFFFDLASEIFS